MLYIVRGVSTTAGFAGIYDQGNLVILLCNDVCIAHHYDGKERADTCYIKCSDNMCIVDRSNYYDNRATQYIKVNLITERVFNLCSDDCGIDLVAFVHDKHMD